MTPSPQQFLALALITESNQPHEWPAIGAVILNRVERDSYPDDVISVLRQPMQFSAFNATRTLTTDEAYLQVRQVHQLGALGTPTSAFEAEALAVAEELLDDGGRPLRQSLGLPGMAGAWIGPLDDGGRPLRRSRRPFGPAVLNYWSPRSMSPRGGLPSWQWAGLRCFTLDGIDPWRFVFAETVDRTHPLAGNARTFDFRAQHAAARKVNA